MAACPSCGFEYEGSFKFCPECAMPLGTPGRPVSQERKVVTALLEIFERLGATAALAETDALLRADPSGRSAPS